MGGAGDHIGIGHGRGMQTRRHQTGDMGHIHHQVGTHLIGDLPEFRKINEPGIGAGTGNDELRLIFQSGFPHGLVVNGLGLIVQAIGDHMEILSGDIHRAAVGQMAAVVQIHAHDCVTGLDQRKKCRQIGVCAGVRLYVGIFAAKQFAGAFPGNVLRDIHGIAAAVIASAGIALGVLIGQAGAHCQHHRLADDILGRDQLDVAALPCKFLLNGCSHLGVKLGDIIHCLLNHKVFLLFPHLPCSP